GMFWLSQITGHSSYTGGLLGPTLLTGAGLGLLFTPLTLTSLSKVHDADAGLAFSLINTGQVVGGSIGLAILGTVAWTVVVNTARNAAHAGGSVAHAGGSVAHAADAAHAAGPALLAGSACWSKQPSRSQVLTEARPPSGRCLACALWPASPGRPLR